MATSREQRFRMRAEIVDARPPPQGEDMSVSLHPKVWRHPRLLTEHVFDKLWQLDCTLREFTELLDAPCEVIEERPVSNTDLEQVVLSLQRRVPSASW